MNEEKEKEEEKDENNQLKSLFTDDDLVIHDLLWTKIGKKELNQEKFKISDKKVDEYISKQN